MKAIDHVTAHYNANKKTPVEVPEWGKKKKPFVLYFDPMTPYERKQIYGANGGVFDAEAAVDTLMMKALDEHGNKLFEPQDRHKLLTEADGGVTGWIATIIAMPTQKAALEKN